MPAPRRATTTNRYRQRHLPLPGPCDTCLDKPTGKVQSSPETDGDGACNQDEVVGCEDPTACNYNIHATDEDRVSSNDPTATPAPENKTEQAP